MIEVLFFMDMKFPQRRVIQVHVEKSRKLNSSGWGDGEYCEAPWNGRSWGVRSNWEKRKCL